MISYYFRNNIYSNFLQKIRQKHKNQKPKSNLVKERRLDLSSIWTMNRQRSSQAQFRHLRLVIFLLLLKIFMTKNQKKKNRKKKSLKKTKSQRSKSLQKLSKRVIKRRFPKSKPSHIRLIRHLLLKRKCRKSIQKKEKLSQRNLYKLLTFRQMRSL